MPIKRRKKWRPFEEARADARGRGLRNGREWRAFARSKARPPDIPKAPNAVYFGEFKGYGDWLGTASHWSNIELLALLSDLRSRLHLLREEEIYVILDRGGRLHHVGAALGGATPRQVIDSLRGDQGSRIERSIQGVTDDEILARAETAPDFDGIVEAAPMESVVHDGKNVGVSGDLPTLATPEGLRAVDGLSLALGSDGDAAEFLVANRVSALWERYITEGATIVDGVLDGDGGRYFKEIKGRFLAEREAVERLAIPEGWAFRVDGTPALPNAMQRRAAWLIREKRRAGNWSGVGAGKTLSAVLASRVVDARISLVVTANAVTTGWCRQIRAAYPDSVVHTVIGDDLVLDRSRHNYIVLNYETFQSRRRHRLVNMLVGLGLDFVVFDEVQFVKQRDKEASLRRRALEALVCAAADANPDLRVLGMSATPVINNLEEARKLLEIVTGVGFPELATRPTVKNALAMHRALMLHGFRYRPPYEQETNTEIVAVARNDLVGALREQMGSVLGVEQVLLTAKMEAARPHIRKGTIVYTHYVDGMIPTIRSYVEEMGLRVGLYTGQDKSGLDAFLDGSVDVLVGSSPLGTGLDGLQARCDRIIMACLPWTGAEYEQIIGRIRRQGSAFRKIDLVVPQVTLDWRDDVWSWDRWRMAAIQYKRTLSDCVTEAHIPEAVSMDPESLRKLGREALERWIERIGEEGMATIERQRLRVPLPADLRDTLRARHGDFSVLNQRWTSSHSATTHARLADDPSEWYLYHDLYRRARQDWPEQPYERIASRVSSRPDWVVGDFGSGEALLAQALPNRVVSLDHVALNETVMACDLATTPLRDGELDVAVFSLSLMGSNWAEYLAEAHRALKPFGFLFIAEPHGRWEGREALLVAAVTDSGFVVTQHPEQRYQFIYLEAMKR